MCRQPPRDCIPSIVRVSEWPVFAQRGVAHRLLELNQQLDELGDVEYFAASASLLADLIPGNPVAWNEVNLTDQSATVLGREGARLEQQPTDLAERVARTGLDHPAIRSYFADPKDAAPI